MSGLDDLLDQVDTQLAGANATKAPAPASGLDALLSSVDNELGTIDTTATRLKNANPFQQAASGVLKGIGGLGDFADFAGSALQGTVFQPKDESQIGFGDIFRSGIQGTANIFSDIQGRERIPDVTKVGEGTYAHKFGEYLPSLLLGGESFAADGVAAGAKSLAKTLASNAVVSGGGFGARELAKTAGLGEAGQSIAEAGGAGIAGLAPYAISSTLKNTAGGIYDSILGFDPTRGKIAGFKDAAGNIVPQAVPGGSQFSKLDPHIETLRSEFIPEISATDSAKSVSNKLSLFKQKAGKDIDSVVDRAASIEKGLFDSSAPHQNAAYLDLTKPDFTEAQSFIDSIADPTVQNNLQKSLDKIQKSVDNGTFTVDSFREFKSGFGEANKRSFNPFSTAEDTAKSDLNNMIYGALAESTQSKIDLLGQATGDDLLGAAFTNANKKFSAASNFENKAFQASKQGVGGVLKDAFNPFNKKPFFSSLARAGAPVQTAKLLDKAGSLTSKFAPGAGILGVGSLLLNAPESNASQIDTPVFSIPKESLPVAPTNKPGVTATQIDDFDLSKVPTEPDKRVKYVEKIIDSDPIDSAIYEMESKRNPLARPYDKKTGKYLSSAKGAFQLLDGTAKALGVKDPLDIADNYTGYKKLRAENEATLDSLGLDSSDPELLYSLHYLGAPVFRKLAAGKALDTEEKKQVDYLQSTLLKRFRGIYNKLVDV